jgi:hypothetical protein
VRHPSLPVLLGHGVLERDDGVTVDEVDPVGDKLIGGEGPTLAFEHIDAVVPELARRRVERQRDLVAGHPPGGPDRLDQHLERVLVGLEIRGETAFVADRSGQPAAVQDPVKRVVGLCTPLDCLGERGSTDRDDHELLKIDVVVRMRAAVQHVHHRHRQHVSVDSSDVAVERRRRIRGGRARDGE